ncbi:MAG: hypothetical protein AB7O92_01960 [Acidimicrobiia bacterium]
MHHERDPGDQLVTARTREVELEDQQVFIGAGRGPSPAESAAADRMRSVPESVRDHYREMLFRGANQRGEGRIDP